jgi:hypothetical protein
LPLSKLAKIPGNYRYEQIKKDPKGRDERVRRGSRHLHDQAFSDGIDGERRQAVQLIF